jgi:hypothetical protein
MEIQRRRFLQLAGDATLSSAPRIAWAQTYPARPVRLIIASAPGGMTDTFARLMGQKLGERVLDSSFSSRTLPAPLATSAPAWQLRRRPTVLNKRLGPRG